MIIKPVRGSIFIKWLHPSLVTDAACLECYSCENMWGKPDFLKLLKTEAVGGYLATNIDSPTGFLVYENQPDEDQVQILNLVMHPEFRREGIATMMIEKVKGVRRALKFDKVSIVVRESNLSGHLFLKKNGFVCDSVLKSYFVDEYEHELEREDGYQFLFKEIK